MRSIWENPLNVPPGLRNFTTDQNKSALINPQIGE